MELDNNQTSNFKDYFSHDSKSYLKFRPSYPKELFDFIGAKLLCNDLAIDFGCGSGQATIELAKICKKVIGIDASSQQVKQAPVNDNITYIVSAFDNIKLENNSIDLITCVNALHWFDIEKFMNISKLALKNNGVIAVWCYSLFVVEAEIYDLFLKIFQELEGYWPPERQIVENKYRDIFFPFDEIDHSPFMIHQKWTSDQIIGHIKTWSSYNNFLKANSYCPIDRLKGQFAVFDSKQYFDVKFNINLRIGTKK